MNEIYYRHPKLGRSTFNINSAPKKIIELFQKIQIVFGDVITCQFNSKGIITASNGMNYLENGCLCYKKMLITVGKDFVTLKLGQNISIDEQKKMKELSPKSEFCPITDEEKERNGEGNTATLRITKVPIEVVIDIMKIFYCCFNLKSQSFYRRNHIHNFLLDYTQQLVGATLNGIETKINKDELYKKQRRTLTDFERAKLDLFVAPNNTYSEIKTGHLRRKDTGFLTGNVCFDGKLIQLADQGLSQYVLERCYVCFLPFDIIKDSELMKSNRFKIRRWEIEDFIKTILFFRLKDILTNYDKDFGFRPSNDNEDCDETYVRCPIENVAFDYRAYELYQHISDPRMMLINAEQYKIKSFKEYTDFCKCLKMENHKNKENEIEA